MLPVSVSVSVSVLLAWSMHPGRVLLALARGVGRRCGEGARRIMSHFSTIKTQIRCLTTLKKALADLGYEFTESEQFVAVRGYLGQETQAVLSIHVSKKFDVGVVVTSKGIEFVADWWGVETTRGLTQERFVQQIVQRYAYHKICAECAKLGFTLQDEEEQEAAVLHVTLARWA